MERVGTRMVWVYPRKLIERLRDLFPKGWFVVWGKLICGSEQTIVGWVCGGDKSLLIGGSVGKLGPRRSVAFGQLENLSCVSQERALCRPQEHLLVRGRFA